MSDVELLTPAGDPLADLPLTWTAGADSTALDVDVWYRRGSTDGGPDLPDVRVGVAIEDPARPGVGVLRGLPPVDELWGRGQELDPATDQPLADEVPIGAHRALALGGPIPVGGRRRVRLVWRPPAFAAAMAWRAYLVVWASEHARALPAAHLGGPGIVTGVGDRQRSALVRGGRLSVSDPPDDQVHVGRRQTLERGGLVGHPTETHTLDRTDGDGVALDDLDRYRAAVVWRVGETSTVLRKGPKGADPEPPTLEPGDRVLDRLLVEAPSGGGAPVLDAAAIEGTGSLYDRYWAVAAADPATLTVHAGDALGGGTHRWWGGRTDVALPTDAAWSLWQIPAGTWEVTTDDTDGPVPPASHPEASLGPWWRGTTDAAGVVTSLIDLRTWSERVVVLPIKATIGAVGDVWATLPVEHPRLEIDRVVLRADLTGATAGRLVIDLEVDGATLWPSATTEAEEPRPSLAWDAASPRDDASIVERATLRAGQVLALRGVELPTGAPLSNVTVSIACLC